MLRELLTGGLRVCNGFGWRFVGASSKPILASVLQHPTSVGKTTLQHFHKFGTISISKLEIPLLCTSHQNGPCVTPQVRSLIKFSRNKGKRKSVKPVLKRFFRLHWGGWIRTIAGRHKRVWKKSGKQRKRMKDHVLCNTTQSYLLDKMVTKFWRKPKYYVDDPYAPYHTREEFHITRRKPI